MSVCVEVVIVFFFNDTATTEIYTLSLHDALPIYQAVNCHEAIVALCRERGDEHGMVKPLTALGLIALQTGNYARASALDRKSTRLNSSHANISYAVFCLKKKKKKHILLLY